MRVGRTLFIVLTVGAIAIAAYSGPARDAASLRKQVETLQAELRAANTELARYEQSPGHLLPLIRTALESEQLDSARVRLDQLAKYHPQATETEAARVLVAEFEARIRADQEAIRAKREAEARVAEKRAIADERAALRRRDQSLSSMRKSVDEMRRITFYYDRSSPEFVNSRSTVYFYIAHHQAMGPFLRMKLIYTGDDWVFFRTVYIKVKERIFTFRFDQFEVERDNGDGGVWEWVDVVAEGEYRELAESISFIGGPVKIRFDGDQYSEERTLSGGDVAAVSRVLDALEALRK